MTNHVVVYLLHFNQKLHHAQHYMGSTDNLERRINEHNHGIGGRLPQVFKDLGIEFVLARTWMDGSRALEKKFKTSYKNGRKLCPICNSRSRPKPKGH